MKNNPYQNQKVELRFSKKAIDKAAQLIRHNCSGNDRDDAIKKIQNFREVHMYPLRLMTNHLSRNSKSVNKRIIVARRLKRLSTIIDKLERPTLDGQSENAIKLTRMQDIGGCRAIVKNLRELHELHEKLQTSRSVHRIISTCDYLNPKPSGYGGIHLVYSCFDEVESEKNWKKTKIEVQLRTELQHAWATSLEIIDTLEQIKLKTSHEDYPEWRRLFSIAGKLVAHEDGAIALDDNELFEYRKELKYLEDQLDLLKKLFDFSIGIKATTSKQIKNLTKKNMGMSLVVMRKQKFKSKKIEENNIVINMLINVSIFGKNQSEEAIQELNKVELEDNVIVAVLLSTSDAKSLKKAYPNYFGSTTVFRSFIKRQIEYLKHNRALNTDAVTRVD
jgi:hypothetical protein